MTPAELKQNNTVEEALTSIRKVMSDHLENSLLTSPYEMARIQSKSSNVNETDFYDPQGGEKENVLELTQLLREDGTISNLKNQERFMSEDVKQEAAQEDTTTNTQDPGAESGANVEDILSLDLTDEVGEPLISPETFAQSAAALSALSNVPKTSATISQTLNAQNAGQYTVESLMRELLRPMLKDWLDANLPSLVKWLVAEQIEKMLKGQAVGGAAPAAAASTESVVEEEKKSA